MNIQSDGSHSDRGFEEELMQFWRDGHVRQILGLKQEDLDVILYVANVKLKEGDLVTAYRMYSTVVLCEPNRFKHQQGLANVCLKIGEFEAAIQAASVMVALEPENPLGYYFSGDACVALGHDVEAREDLAEALSRADKLGDAVLQRACLRLVQRLDKSV